MSGRQPQTTSLFFYVKQDRLLDEEEEEDDEIRYLQKMKLSKVATDPKSSKSVKTKHDVDEHFGSSSRKKMKGSDREANDGNHVEEENISGLTKRQRALHNGGSSIEFLDGLPPAPSRKQKLTEEEKLAKKVEAAQRRKMQVEKANRESEVSSNNINFETKSLLHQHASMCTILRNQKLFHRPRLQVVSPCMERAVLDQLVRYFNTRLAGYPTTLSEDKKLLEDNMLDKKKLVLCIWSRNLSLSGSSTHPRRIIQIPKRLLD